MKHRTNNVLTFLVCLSVGLLIAGLNNSAYAEEKKVGEKQQMNQKLIHGKVTQTMGASGYTYAEVDTGKEKIWAAGPVTPLKVGDMVTVSKGMPMKNFHSKTLERDFAVVYFIGSFNANVDPQKVKASGMASLHAHSKQNLDAAPVTGISKVKGGKTISEILSDKKNLSGKTVRVRGKVTKYSAEIMGKNWLHIKDSSTQDYLVVTTNSTAAINDVIIFEGKLALDKDFGYGYIYPVILEDAGLTKE